MLHTRYKRIFFLCIGYVWTFYVGAKPPPKCFVSSWTFHIIYYFALLKKYWLFLHQTWQISRRPIANYIYVKNVSKCQSCDVTVMTSCFLPVLKFLTCIFFTMCSKEHIKGSWNLKKLCKIWGPPLENPQIGAVILFQQMQLCCTCDVPDD